MEITSNYQDYINIPSVEIRYSQMIKGLFNIYKDNLGDVLKRNVGINIKKPKETIMDYSKYSSLMNFYILHQRKWHIQKPELYKNNKPVLFANNGEINYVSFN